MFNTLRELFKSRVDYRIVEVKAPRPIVRWDNTTKETISTLNSHPGFVALMEKLSLTKAQLESKNNTQWKKDLREADFLQSGIFWCNWLQDEVNKSTSRGSIKQYIDPMQEELEAFQKLDANIERVGMDETRS